MRRGMTCLPAMTLALALGAFDRSAADAAELREASCSGSPFAFPATEYRVECEHSQEMVRAEGESGSMEIDVMTISSDDPPMFLTVASQVLRASHLYIDRRNLSESMHKFFSGGTFEDWHGVGNKSGYDAAEFTAEISGLPSHCVAIQRYTNPAFLGYKRHIVGMGCAIDSVAPVYDAIAKLQAPGD